MKFGDSIHHHSIPHLLPPEFSCVHKEHMGLPKILRQEWKLGRYSFCPQMVPFNWAMIWGGAKNIGGGERTGERALPKVFGPLQRSFWSAQLWILLGKTKSTVKAGLLEYCWNRLEIYSGRSDNRKSNFRGASEEALLEGLLTVHPDRILGFSDLYRKDRATTPRGVENVPYEGGGPRPIFGRGVIREVFLPPYFSTPPPWRPLISRGFFIFEVVLCHARRFLKTDLKRCFSFKVYRRALMDYTIHSATIVLMRSSWNVYAKWFPGSLAHQRCERTCLCIWPLPSPPPGWSFHASRASVLSRLRPLQTSSVALLSEMFTLHASLTIKINWVQLLRN